MAKLLKKSLCGLVVRRNFSNVLNRYDTGNKSHLLKCSAKGMIFNGRKILPLSTQQRNLFKSTSDIPPLNSIDDVATFIKGNASNIMVMTGAGISTPSGIPDF
ncbi:unnamed protein product, partial [Meganyctiphanes norvegica]